VSEPEKPEVYLSYDIESNGPVPGLYSMLSFGVAAFTLNDGLIATFERNLKLLPGATEDPRTMEEFWVKFPEVYMKTRVNTVDPKQAMLELDKWVADFEPKYKIVNVAGPAAFDFPWIAYYMNYAKPNKQHHVGYACFDIRSYAAAVLKTPYRMTGKRSYPAQWYEGGLPHTHVALDDAIEQGAITFHMMREHLGLPRKPFLANGEARRSELVASA
jgi:hypothetical protein